LPLSRARRGDEVERCASLRSAAAPLQLPTLI